MLSASRSHSMVVTTFNSPFIQFCLGNLVTPVQDAIKGVLEFNVRDFTHASLQSSLSFESRNHYLRNFKNWKTSGYVCGFGFVFVVCFPDR